MVRYVALLRGINVGGNNKVPMADLRALASNLGLGNAQTILQSGNLIFESTAEALGLESMLEEQIQGKFGFHVDVHVRSMDHCRSVVAANPFAREAADDPSHLVVACFKSEISVESCDALRSAIKGREYFHAVGRELYVVYPDGIGDSKLTNQVLDSKLGQRGTARNWNTMLKILSASRVPGLG